MPVIELPFNQPGKIYASPMPFGPSDYRDEILDMYVRLNVEVVVMLADDRECLERSGRDLRNLYRDTGLEVIYLPTPDFATPARDDLQEALEEAFRKIHAGKNLAIHCNAGIGRTGMFAASLAKKTMGLSGEEAIAWVRKYIHSAVEVPEQRKLVMEI